jgi:DNA-binding SARP family transcriptional activator
MGAGNSNRSVSPGRRLLALRLRLDLLGPMRLRRAGVCAALPPSRKARGLLAYLVLTPTAVSRARLCELFWGTVDDPRAELRWSLSRVRRLIDGPEHSRLVTLEDGVSIDQSDIDVDASAVSVATAAGVGTLAHAAARELLGLYRGEFLEGLELDDSPLFAAWLTAQRQRFRGIEIALLEALVARTPDDDVDALLERWRQLAPFDRRVHELLLEGFARSDRLREGEEHLAATARLFESEGLDARPLHAAWRAARQSQVSALAVGVPTAAVQRPGSAETTAARRASVAVLPFVAKGVAQVRGGLGDALAHDVVTRLAKLRSLFVIARGTVLALAERGIGAEQVGRLLNVDYVAGGTYRCIDGRLIADVELVASRTTRILWAETFDVPLPSALRVLDEVGNRIVAAIAQQIETAERNLAILKPPSSLDAWEAHHRGLWHMYLFGRKDNERARQFFETAIRLDPTFSRAYAGLSFTHFQDAFQRWAERDMAMTRAFEAAGRSLLIDDRDPAAHWAMGRALWLQSRSDEALPELEQAVALSPNFALGHYTLAFVHGQTGDPEAAIRAADLARSLSPFDPLLFGMLGARALALVRLERFEEAAEWAVQAAARPNAHVHILAIAAFTLALAGSMEAARAHAAAVWRLRPGYGSGDFFTAFRFDPVGERLFRQGARLVGVA